MLSAGSAPTCARGHPVTGPRRRAVDDVREGLAHLVAPFRGCSGVAAAGQPRGERAVLRLVLRLVAAGFPAVQIGLVETAAGAAGLLGALLAPWLIDRVPTGRLTIAAPGLVPLLVPLALEPPRRRGGRPGPRVLLNPAGNAGIGSYRVAVTPDALQGRVQSTTQFVSMSTMPLSPVLAGGLLPGLGGTGRDRGAGRALRAGRADPHAEPVGALGAPPGRVARGPPAPATVQTRAAWTPTSPAAPPARSRPCTP